MAKPALCAPALLCLQARQKLSSTCGSISQMYSFVDQATEATAAQLESTKLALQQHSAKQPATAEAPLEPGPGQVRHYGLGHILADVPSAQAHVKDFVQRATCMAEELRACPPTAVHAGTMQMYIG